MTAIATEPRVLRPVPDAPNFQLTLYAEPQGRGWRDTIDTAAQEKALAQLARGGAPRKARAKSPAFRVLDSYAATRQKWLYEEAMGRTWEEIDPEPRADDFGGPAYPSYPQALDRYERRRHTRAELRRINAAHAEAVEAWRIESEAYHAAYDAWKASPEYNAWQAAHRYWATRQEQFAWTGRGRDAKSLAELVNLTIDGEPARA